MYICDRTFKYYVRWKQLYRLWRGVRSTLSLIGDSSSFSAGNRTRTCSSDFWIYYWNRTYWSRKSVTSTRNWQATIQTWNDVSWTYWPQTRTETAISLKCKRPQTRQCANGWSIMPAGSSTRWADTTKNGIMDKSGAYMPSASWISLMNAIQCSATIFNSAALTAFGCSLTCWPSFRCNFPVFRPKP